MNQPPHVAGFVAVIGHPNAGKSTLCNRLLGEKINIVSPKPPTTRQAVRGILSLASGQIVLVDTPGLCRPGSLLPRSTRQIATAAAAGADLLYPAITSGSRAIAV